MEIVYWPRSVFYDCNEEIIAWLQQCFDKMIAGEKLLPNPFYERNEKLTPEITASVVAAIEDKYKYELEHTPGYHLRVYFGDEYINAVPREEGNLSLNPEALHQYAATKLRRPEFDALSYEQQFAIVQGMDEIYVRYREKAKEVAAKEESNKDNTPVYYEEDYNYS